MSQATRPRGKAIRGGGSYDEAMAASSSDRPAIAVVGAGGVGGLLAAMLARGGNDVRVLARGAALAAILERGLRISGPGDDDTVPIRRAADDAGALGPADIVIVAVKTWQLAELAPRLTPLLGPQTLVVPMQNGVEAADTLARALGEGHVIGGVCRVIAWAERPGEIHWMGAPMSLTIGARLAGQQGAVDACAAILRTGGIEVVVAHDIARAVWLKLMFLAPFGAVGAVERAPIGDLRRRPELRARIEGAMHEIAALAAARSVSLPADAVAAAMRRLDELPDDATTSMHRDIVAGRPSELDEQIGAVVRLGREAQIATPVSAELYARLAPLERHARRC
jgi:2-dehydropantoate 2-reductase